MIVRNKLMVPNGAAHATGWSMTSIVHLPRFAPQVALGSEAVFKVRREQTALYKPARLAGSCSAAWCMVLYVLCSHELLVLAARQLSTENSVLRGPCKPAPHAPACC